MNEPPVRILILGPPEIYVNGKLVTIKRRINRALLYYLAVQRHPVSRDELSALFWPEENNETARKNLRESLSRIRTEMGVKNLLATNDEQISLNKDLVTVDATEVDNLLSPLLSSSEMNGAARLPDWTVTQIKTATALCRTNHFLQGFSLPDSAAYENWLAYYNQAFYYTLAKVFDRMSDHYISEGNLEEAILWLSKALELNPLDEDQNYLMLICLRDTGRNQQLLDYVGYLERIFKPQQIPQRFTELWKQVSENKTIPAMPGSAWPLMEQDEPPFIGRIDELEKLSRLLRRRGLVTLKGEAGIGKTRLIKQFFEQQSITPRLLYVHGFPLATRVVFFPIYTAMRDQILDEEWQLLDEQDQQRLSYFFHSTLQEDQRPKVPGVQDEWLPVLEDVFFSFMRLLEIAAAHRPLLFVLDDAHLLDLGSISLMAFLIEQGLFEKHGLLVVSYSPEVENPNLNMMLQEERRERRLETIQLSPLSSENISIFIETVVGIPPERSAVDIMRRMSGGNPYFLTECVRATKWKISGRRTTLNAEECPIPDSVAALVRDKVRGLEPESEKLIKAAAILGRKFCPDVLEEMTGFDSSGIATSIEELIREGFLMVNHEIHPLGSYEFKHDVEREYLLRNLTPSQLRDSHLRAARALKKRRGDFPRFSEALALHWETALEHVDALIAWLDAGRYARSQFSKEETYRVYGRGLDLITKAPKLYPDQTIYEVINEFGNYTYDRDDMATCQKIYQTCLDVGEVAQNRKLIGTAYNGLGRVAFFNNQFDLADKYLRQANWFLEETGMAVEQIKSDFLLGSIYYSLDNYYECRDWFEKALVYTTNLSEPYLVDVRIDILSMLCATLCYLGEVKRALELAEEMVNLSSLATRRSASLQAYAVLATCEYFNDHMEKAIKIYQETLPLVERFQLRFWHSLIEIAAALAYLETGDLDNAWYLADQAYKRELPYKTEKLSMHAAKALGDYYRSVGNQEKATEYYSENINTGVKNFQTTISKYYLGVTLIDAGKRNEGQKWIDEAIRDAGKKGFKGIESTMRMGRLFFGLRRKLSGNVIAEAQEVLAQMRGLQNPEVNFFETSLKAFLFETAGNLDDAITCYQQAIMPVNTGGNVWLELLGYERILKIAPAGNPAIKSSLKRIQELMELMQDHATYPLVKREFQKLRIKIKKIVNAVSTTKVYK